MSLPKIAWLALIVGLALGLRLYRLGQENFWVDEVAYVQDASQRLYKIVDYSTAPRTRVHHVTPFPHLLVHFFILPKPSETAARLPSAIFGTLEVLLLFVVARQLFSVQVAFLAAFFLALSPLHLWYSQEARWYAQWSFLTTCSYIALLYAWQNNRTSAWIGYGVTTLLNFYTFVYSSLVVALQTLSVLLARHGERVKRTELLGKYVAVHAGAVVAAVPILWMILRGLEKSSGTPRPVGLGDLPYTFFSYAAGFSAGPTLSELHALPGVLEVIYRYKVVLIFFLVFFPAIIFGMRELIRHSTAAAFVMPWLLGLPVLVFVIAAVTNLTYQVRYTLPALPAFATILALGVLSLRAKPVRLGLTAGIVFCSLYSIGNFYWETRYDKEEIRAAVSHIHAAGTGKNPIFSIGQISRTVRYYGDGVKVIDIAQKSCDGAASENMLQEHSSSASKKFWLIAGRDWKDKATACLEKLSRFYTIVDHRSFTGTEIWLFEARP